MKTRAGKKKKRGVVPVPSGSIVADIPNACGNTWGQLKGPVIQPGWELEEMGLGGGEVLQVRPWQEQCIYPSRSMVCVVGSKA